MIIPVGKNHFNFYQDNKYSKGKITSKYEGVEFSCVSDCCGDVLLNWDAVVVKDGKKRTVAVRPFTEQGEYDAYLAYLKYKDA